MNIKVCEKNRGKIQAALDREELTARGKKRDIEDIFSACKRAEREMRDINMDDRRGAVLYIFPDENGGKGKVWRRVDTCARLHRRPAGWFLTNVWRADHTLEKSGTRLFVPEKFDHGRRI